MNGNNIDLILAMGKYMDKEQILDKILDGIKAYKNNKSSKEAYENVCFFNLLFVTNFVMDKKSVEEMRASFNTHQLITERFKAKN